MCAQPWKIIVLVLSLYEFVFQVYINLSRFLKERIRLQLGGASFIYNLKFCG